jgi:hypothetical protein
VFSFHVQLLTSECGQKCCNAVRNTSFGFFFLFFDFRFFGFIAVFIDFFLFLDFLFFNFFLFFVFSFCFLDFLSVFWISNGFSSVF